MKLRLIAAAFLAAAAIAGPAPAQDNPVIASARAAGLAGERYDGYLGLAASASAAVRQQVAAVNLRRRTLYTQLAQRRGASPQEVGITAGCQLLASVAVGEAYMLGDNVWRRRLPGQSARVPDYCG